MERAKAARKSHSNTSDLLTWSQPSPSAPPPTLRSPQRSDGIGNVVFGGLVTDEEHEILSRRRKPCSGYKMKDMIGSGIFAALESGTSNRDTKMSVRMVQQATNGITHISFGSGETVAAAGKPTSITRVAKQRELSGTLKSESDKKFMRQQVSDAKSKELSGHDIFGPPPTIPPRSLAAARSLESKEKNNVDQPGPRNVRTSVKVSNPAGGQSNVFFSEEPVVKTTRKIHNQKFQDLTGNNIFKGETPLGSAEKPLSQAKFQEMSGSNIFSDGGKVAARDYFRGSRQPPGGDSTIALM